MALIKWTIYCLLISKQKIDERMNEHTNYISTAISTYKFFIFNFNGL